LYAASPFGKDSFIVLFTWKGQKKQEWYLYIYLYQEVIKDKRLLRRRGQLSMQYCKSRLISGIRISDIANCFSGYAIRMSTKTNDNTTIGIMRS